MLIYWQCLVAPLSDKAAVQCDCEKQLVSNNPGSNGLPITEHSSSRLRPEEVFSVSTSLLLAGISAAPAPIRPEQPRYIIPAGYTGTIFQPPREE